MHVAGLQRGRESRTAQRGKSWSGERGAGTSCLRLQLWKAVTLNELTLKPRLHIIIAPQTAVVPDEDAGQVL